MNKRIIILLSVLLLTITAQAQQKIVTETYYLPNGLQVILAEEHSQPQIFGGIFVHAGSKNEDPNITGVAHYFEHMMFKGTDQIGTIDWTNESKYLDSISHQYDLLHATTDEASRKTIQKEINRLNIAASKYAIPNEVDAILSKIGSTGVNAGTSYDYTVYYNTFPSNQAENWMDIYAERFRYPVFRLFQSELEAVYEEKNMYEDSPIYAFQRRMFAECFGEHPYSRDVIGYGEHLKNPQPSEMRRFFDTYYVANNMCLILVGDFDIKAIKTLIAEKFASLPNRPLPAKKTYLLPTFDKQVVKEVKLTPIPLGMIVFKGVEANNPDVIPLSVLSALLSGGSGLLDRATSQGRLMMAQYTNVSLEDAGINLVMYAPNLLKQSHSEAEKVVWDCIDSIKQGNFSDELLQAIKTTAIVEREHMVEEPTGLAQLFQELAMTGKTYQQWLEEGDQIQGITRQDIIIIANKYLNPDHCTIVRSKMGFPKKDAVAKPDWDHLEAQNIGAQSDFARDIYARAVTPVKPQHIAFGKDVRITPINEHFDLYSNTNPKNNLFSLAITYDYGFMDDPDLDKAATYFSSIGSGKLDREAFNLQLQLLGADFSVSVDDDHTTLFISGYDNNLDQILDLVRSRFDNPRHDQQQINQIVDMVKTEARSSKSDADTWFSALTSKVRYGENSSFLRHTPIKTWAQTADTIKLMNEFQAIFLNGGHVTYTGNLPDKQLIASLKKHNLIADNAVDQPIRAYRSKYNDLADNQVYYVHNNKFGQSNIQIIMPSLEIAPADEPIAEVFQEYYGAGSMNSIIFQEIREFRSLGYSTYGIYQTDKRHINGGRLMTYLGTQCDKTLDGTDALLELMTNVPIREDKFTIARDFKALQLTGRYIGFRSQPAQVYDWRHIQGYDNDPRSSVIEKIPSLTINDLQHFIDKYIANCSHLVIISGNTKRFKAKNLQKYGIVTRYKQADIMQF